MTDDRDYVSEAREMGRQAALNMGSWVEMSPADAESILTDVDPMVMDAYNGPNLTGEMAGESIPEIFAGFPDPWAEELHDAWTEAADETWSAELDRIAREALAR